MAVYAGTFDPFTLGHLDVVETAMRLFDRLTVLVAFNPHKPGSRIFTPDERVEMIRASLSRWVDRVDVHAHGGLVAPYAERIGACALVRGMRPVSDPDYEIQLSLMNSKLVPNLPTVLLVARSEHMYLSSSFVRDTAEVDNLIPPGTVPPPVEAALRARFAQAGQAEPPARTIPPHLDEPAGDDS